MNQQHRISVAVMMAVGVMFWSACGGDDDDGVAVCGNEVVEGDELCDDGNTWGGDGCAENCTTEDRRVGASLRDIRFQYFGGTSLQMGRGEAVYTTGQARESAGNGEIPFVVKVNDIRREPVPTGGVGAGNCTCTRPVEYEAFGPGNTARGVIGCGDGLDGVDYFVSVDHSINDVDPNCETGLLEDASQPHPGVCNGLVTRTFSGRGPAGSLVAEFFTKGNTIQGPGGCSTDPTNPGKGLDGIPCNDDDPDQGWEPQIGVQTTGTAEAEVLDALTLPGVRMGDGEEMVCGPSPCQARLTGVPADCAMLAANPTGGLSGTVTVNAIARIHTWNTDSVSTVRVTAE